MKELKHFNIQNHTIEYLFTDIDDTLTNNGHLRPAAYEALWLLYEAHIKVIPVTGRPAGWCELIARQWPVAGVIGENGGFYFSYQNGKMNRFFSQKSTERKENKIKLIKIYKQIKNEVPHSRLSSDQFCRLIDLAIDYCEDIPRLNDNEIKQIIEIFHQHEAQCKLSSIHINGWFGEFDKLSTSLYFLKTNFKLSLDQIKKKTTFIGDSPNDEPMFEFFPLTFGVSNLSQFESQLKHFPTYIAPSPGGEGFKEISQKIIS